jgi:hypothetical protein
VITRFSLVPAGTHGGKAIVDDLINARNPANRSKMWCGIP